MRLWVKNSSIQKQVDILLSKIQTLQLLYLKYYVYKTSWIIIDNKPNEINKNLITTKIKQPYHTVLNTIKITYRIYPYRNPGIYFL